MQYTSVSSDPSNPVADSKGIWDIFLYDNSKLLWLDGAIDEITLCKDATAILKGGYIDAITIQHRPQDSCYVEIWCQDGWSWVYDGTDIVGIAGLWEDGTSFDIGFNDNYPYTTAPYVNVVEVPEPATLALFGLGGLLLRRKK